ncbi:MAG: hypothetical protein AMXMBFR83_14810 [Phycisphaerae bacterium]
MLVIALRARKLLGGLLIVSASLVRAGERQVTRDADWNHELDNNDNFSPDDRFLVFDTRPAETAIIRGRVIAKVEIATGQTTVLYRAEPAGEFGPGVGAAGYAPDRDEVVFIHGPLRPSSPADQYEKHRRCGMIAAGDGSGRVRFADARDVRPPFTPGALRGGTHRHEFSGDGEWLGFTYNDEVIRAHGLAIGRNLDLRTIGVTRLGRPVRVPPQAQFPDHADGFSVLVVSVTPDPAPGSDEISHAAGDSWVGSAGYLKPDGTRQRARAFIGTTRDAAGTPLDELFIVDIPEDVTRPGPLGPLQGTPTQLPAPPAGAVQRRLTRTADAPHPGCQGIVRCSPDGSRIAFRMRDDRGQWQVFLMSPLGGTPEQVTRLDGGVTGGPRWHPSGKTLFCIAGSRIVATCVEPGPRFGHSAVLIDRDPPPYALVVSRDGNTLAYNRVVKTAGRDVSQIFVMDCRHADGQDRDEPNSHNR